MKVLFITPHLSTGGMPKVLLERIRYMTFAEVGVIEWTNIDSDSFSVQKNQIKQLVHYYKTLPLGDKSECIKYIKEFDPDVLHFEDFTESPAWGMYDNSYQSTYEALFDIHSLDIPIVNTSHSSVFTLDKKKYRTDYYFLVSNYHKLQYNNLLNESNYEVIEHPYIVKDVDDIEINRCINKLNFDRRKKHILTIGLFNRNKNQGYLFYLATLLGSDYHFHFVGQMSDTNDWKEYWEFLIENKPPNVFCYDERDDVDDFIVASDLVIHPSLFELNPTIFYESLSLGKPVIAFPLETYSYSSYHDKLNYFRHDNLKDVVIDPEVSQIKSSSLLYNLELIESVVGKNILVKDTTELFKNKIMNFYENV